MREFLDFLIDRGTIGYSKTTSELIYQIPIKNFRIDKTDLEVIKKITNCDLVWIQEQLGGCFIMLQYMLGDISS